MRLLKRPFSQNELIFSSSMQNLLLLHGALGASVQLLPLLQQLKNEYNVFTLDFSGHGGKSMPSQAFSIEAFAEEALQFMEEKGVEQTNILGYSMGGYVALYLAKCFPEKIAKIITLATKFHWDEAVASKEIQMLNAEKIAAKLLEFAKTLKERHEPNDWKELLLRTAEMLTALGRNNTLKPEDYRNIQSKVLVLLGDRDKMITLEETVSVYKSLPDAQMGMLPDTHHPIEQTDISTLAFFTRQFLG